MTLTVDSIKLKVLKLSGDFNQSIDNLPRHLNNLEISGDFNQSIENLPHLSKLRIDTNSINGNIEWLPPSLTYLFIKKVPKNFQPPQNLCNLACIECKIEEVDISDYKES